MSDDVKRLREEYENALDEAEAKRSAYHAAIRRLYMGGMPLREIAELLDLSHQRVHKIVGVEPKKRKRRRLKGSSIAAVIILLVTAASGVWGARQASAENLVSISVHARLAPGVKSEIVEPIRARLAEVGVSKVRFSSAEEQYQFVQPHLPHVSPRSFAPEILVEVPDFARAETSVIILREMLGSNLKVLGFGTRQTLEATPLSVVFVIFSSFCVIATFAVLIFALRNKRLLD